MSAQRRWSGPPLGPMAVIGVGQIGGSVALGARVAGAVTEVVAWSRTKEKLDRAQALGIIDRAARSTAEAARGAAIVVLATPVRSLGEAAAAIAQRAGRRGAGVRRRQREGGGDRIRGAQAAAGRLRRLPPDRRDRAGRPGRGQPAAVRRQALRDLPDAAEQRGGRRDGRAAVDGDGRRAGAHDGRAARPRVRARAATCRTSRPMRWRRRWASLRPTSSRASGGCRRPACATRRASPRPARRCGATSCSTTAPRCCR